MYTAQFTTNPDTGAVDVKIDYDFQLNPRSHILHFNNMESALIVVNNDKRDYIRFKIERWVVNKKVLFETGEPGFYKTAKKIASLDVCLRYNAWNVDAKLKGICSYFLKIEEHFTNVLPPENNHSYTTARLELEEIKKFCIQETTTPPAN